MPWWRLARPTEEERLRRREDGFIDEQGRSTARWRPRYDAAAWLDLACDHLDIDKEALRGRGRHPEVVRQRELVGPVGVERFGVKVTELATSLGKSRDGVSQWVRRGAGRRAVEPDFAAAAQELDLAASEEA